MPVSKIISTNYNSTRTKGTIQSLYDKELNCELVDSSSPWELGAFIYEKLGNRDHLFNIAWMITTEQD